LKTANGESNARLVEIMKDMKNRVRPLLMHLDMAHRAKKEALKEIFANKQIELARGVAVGGSQEEGEEGREKGGGGGGEAQGAAAEEEVARGEV